MGACGTRAGRQPNPSRGRRWRARVEQDVVRPDNLLVGAGPMCPATLADGETHVGGSPYAATSGLTVAGSRPDGADPGGPTTRRTGVPERDLHRHAPPPSPRHR